MNGQLDPQDFPLTKSRRLILAPRFPWGQLPLQSSSIVFLHWSTLEALPLLMHWRVWSSLPSIRLFSCRRQCCSWKDWRCRLIQFDGGHSDSAVWDYQSTFCPSFLPSSASSFPSGPPAMRWRQKRWTGPSLFTVALCYSAYFSGSCTGGRCTQVLS